MNHPETNTGPILAIDIGKISTRALLLDRIKGQFHLLGVGKSYTTIGVYGPNLRHGVRAAIEELQALTGRVLLNLQKDLIRPVSQDGLGVSQCITTISAGPPLKVYIAGLEKDAPLSSALRLGVQSFAGQIKSISLTDIVKKEAVLDDILQYQPDLIILESGTDRGASRSVAQLLEPIQLAFQRTAEDYRAEILYVGNPILQPIIQAIFKNSPHLHLGPNIRTNNAAETLAAANELMARIIMKIRIRQLPGATDLMQWSQGNMLPSATGLGYIIRYLSQSHNATKGVLGVDLGPFSTTVAAAFNGRLSIGVYPQPTFLDTVDTEMMQEFHRWLSPVGITDNIILEYAFNKSIYPACLPMTEHELAIQNAFARLALQDGIRRILADFPNDIAKTEDGQLPWVEPILASGSVLSHTTSPGQTCLLLLDGLQPTGITTLVVDQDQIAAPLGAVASLNPTATSQVLNTDIFLHLATVISPMGHAPSGTPILRVKMILDDGHEIVMDVKQGELEVIPLQPGKHAQIQLQPFHRYEIGMGGGGRGGSLRVSGSILGIVIDGRGRPLTLPGAPDRRRELQRKWLWMLGG